MKKVPDLKKRVAVALAATFLIVVVALYAAAGLRQNRTQATNEVAQPAMAADAPTSSTRESENRINESETRWWPGQMFGGMMGNMEDMMRRHMAPIPAEYANRSNPISSTADSRSQGEEIYQIRCAVCHGDDGRGDGPAAAALDPSPAAIAHSGSMLSDAYLFYRISEGGNFPPFDSSMPAFKEILDEEERWHLINYIRNLRFE
jgi:mono/diheme cytochrome c family protein